MFLRHASRHVHHTVANHIEGALAQLGWTDAATTPFGAPALKFQRTVALSGGRVDTKIEPGLVSITLGDEFNPDMEEMGGPLARQDYPIFVDIFMDTDATALSVAVDVEDILLGRFEFAKRFIPVIDQALGQPVVGWQIELDDVERVRPDSTYQFYWQVVKVTAVTHFNEVAY